MSLFRLPLPLLLPFVAGALLWVVSADAGTSRPPVKFVSADASLRTSAPKAPVQMPPALLPFAPPPALETPAPAAPSRPTYTHREILDAIRTVETGDAAHPRDGDDGQAIGPYQIWRSYWRDAVSADPSLRWIEVDGARRVARYEDCRRMAYAEAVVTAYMQRHAPDAWRQGDAETIARVHNGGPAGPRRAASRAYWGRVHDALGAVRPRLAN
jgi:hypothetical protein